MRPFQRSGAAQESNLPIVGLPRPAGLKTAKVRLGVGRLKVVSDHLSDHRRRPSRGGCGLAPTRVGGEQGAVEHASSAADTDWETLGPHNHAEPAFLHSRQRCRSRRMLERCDPGGFGPPGSGGKEDTPPQADTAPQGVLRTSVRSLGEVPPERPATSAASRGRRGRMRYWLGRAQAEGIGDDEKSADAPSRCGSLAHVAAPQRVDRPTLAPPPPATRFAADQQGHRWRISLCQ